MNEYEHMRCPSHSAITHHSETAVEAKAATVVQIHCYTHCDLDSQVAPVWQQSDVPCYHKMVPMLFISPKTCGLINVEYCEQYENMK